MSHGAPSSLSPDRSAPRARRQWTSRPFRLLALALAGTAAVSATLVLPGWIPTLPRPIRRELTEATLQTVLVVFIAIFIVGLCGAIGLAWPLTRSFRGHTFRPGIARLFLASVSCLVGVIFLEMGAGVWRAWMHRFPRLPTEFADRTVEEYRIVVVGGSSAAGEPYWPWLSVGQIVAWQLGEAVPNRRFECEILAYPGDSLELQHQKLAALEHRPDAVIIDVGHNEFVARFEEEREGWQDEQTATTIARLTQRATKSSAFCSLAYEIISKNRLDRPPSLALRHQIIDPPLCSDVEFAEIRDDFRRRLDAIVSYCGEIGALPILMVPPANEAGYEPGRSTMASSISADERRRVSDEFRRARSLESTDPGASEVAYATILERHPGFAEAHFRLARLLERQSRLSEASTHYLAALDNDGLPVRCPAPFRSAFLDVSERHPGAILIDGRRELIAVSANGLIGDELIHDTHHPTLRGYLALSGAVLRELDRRQVFGRGHEFALPLDPAVCAAHFGMNAERWRDVCDRVSQHYKRVAGYRYDPAERLEKSRRHAEAAQRIKRGEPIGDLGLPGFPDAALPQTGQKAKTPSAGQPHLGRTRREQSGQIGTGPSFRPRSLRHQFDLPILQIDGGTAAQEVDDGDELVTLCAADHFSYHPGQGPSRDPDGRSDRDDLFRDDRQTGAEHRMNLFEVGRNRVLINHVEHIDQPMSAERRQPSVLVPLQEQVAHEQGDNRL
jgi:hypothetical protein